MSQYRCPECGYVYDEKIGDEFEGFPPGTPFAELPSDFACPDCSVREKIDFEKVS
jgi:rubredoxin